MKGKTKMPSSLCHRRRGARNRHLGPAVCHHHTFPNPPRGLRPSHRTHRTGGKRGVAVSLISLRELGNFYYLKLTYKIRPEERTLPTEAELQTLREGQYMDRLQRISGTTIRGQSSGRFAAVARE